ncbi:hypothetical protein BV20DRAFT_945715 [Pilatotrama ljubarskyi]|nr:hypothetical protein BV20DRAFT_945715 [Pilatotrama ljubarskyi]
MQSYSHPDVFFCPLYNPPGVSDPISSILSGASDHWTSSLTPPSPPSATLITASASSSSVSPPSSPSPSSSTSASTSSSSTASPAGSSKVQKYRRMCAKSGKPLLDFVAEVESRRIMHEKRRQVRAPAFHASLPR